MRGAERSPGFVTQGRNTAWLELIMKLSPMLNQVKPGFHYVLGW